MLSIFKIITALLVTLIISFHLFNQISNAIIIGIYPYVIAITLLFCLLIILNRFIESGIMFNIIRFTFIGIAVFGCFTFFQVWRNAKLLNGYQQDRSNYMNELHAVTKSDGAYTELISGFQRGIVNLIEANTGIPVTMNNEVVLMDDGISLIDEMIEEISTAKHHIHIEFFIIRDDEIGKKFINTLINKAEEGVKVRLIYDGLGSRELNKEMLKKLSEGGVGVGIYDNVRQSILKGKLNHRNHRKILVIDGEIGYVGGFNIGDEYLGRDDEIGPWQDLQIKAKGEIVHWMQKIFLGDWYYVTEERIVEDAYFPTVEINNSIASQMVTSGYDTHWNEISQLYFSLITGAEEKVYIATPYLILNDSMVKALQTTALRGVDVRIIVPEKPDLFIVGWANSSFYQDLLKAGVKIYLFQEGFIHSKAFTVDGEITSVGSANFNTRSLYLDYEVNAVVYDKGIAKDMINIFDLYINKSIELTPMNYKTYPASHNKLKHIISKLLIPFT